MEQQQQDAGDGGWVVLDNGRRVRRTQMDAYEALKETGALSRLQWETYHGLYRLGPLTRNELDTTLAPGKANPPFSRRLAELERFGVIHRALERPCRVTQRVCDAWDITDRKVLLPDPRPERRPDAKVLQAQLALTVAALRRYMQGDPCRCQPRTLFSEGVVCRLCQAVAALKDNAPHRGGGDE